jgi:phage gp29-like protein
MEMTTSLAQRFLGKFGRRTPMLEEIAAAQTRMASTAFRLASYTPDDLLSQKGLAIYDEMQKDTQVRCCLNTKKFAVLAKGWDVLPASNEPADVEIARFVKFCLEDMRGSVQDALFKVLDSVAKGFSIAEINYKVISDGPYAGMIGLDSLKAKDPAAFGFDMDEFLNIRALTHLRQGFGGQADLPVEKFIIYTYMPQYELPHGQSDLRAAYKHWWSKEVILKFWNMYLEKFGMPTAKGTYRRGTPKDQQDELLRVLDKIQQETAIVVPEDVAIELLEAQRRGDAGYRDAVEFHNKQIAKAILGQTLTSDEGTRVGSLALARVHQDVLYFYLEKLKRDLEESVMREQLIRRLVEMNYGPAGRMVNGQWSMADGGSKPSATPSRCPRFALGSLEEQDLEVLGGLITKLVDGKVIAPDEPWIRGYLGLPAA